jgi:hypothetical protein
MTFFQFQNIEPEHQRRFVYQNGVFPDEKADKNTVTDCSRLNRFMSKKNGIL